jgi:lipoprotein-anchoring transpeptidase ErfK/SrfK
VRSLRVAPWTGLAVAGLTAVVVNPAFAQPWGSPFDSPPFAGVRSVTVVGRDEPLYVEPGPEPKRRGAAQLLKRLPVYAARYAEGCAGPWLMVGPLAWVCSSRVEISTLPSHPAVEEYWFENGLPYRYHFVGEYGTFGYRDLETAERGTPDAEIEPGFALAIRRVKAPYPGDPFGLTTKGVWVPMRDIHPARELLFEGEELDGSLDIAWVYQETADVYAAPGGRRVAREAHSRFVALEVLETRERFGKRWFRIGDAQWVSDRQVRAPTAAMVPAGLRPGERWIDVDTANQVLVAYEGERPVFATLVSTGKGHEGSELATPRGEHRIWVKLLSSDMDNLENEEASRYYAIQDVPWVMYFDRGYGLHGTFWHRSFGRVRSHGCVNLAPLDAQRLYHWTSPPMPTGWSAVLPTEYDPGTLVRVR